MFQALREELARQRTTFIGGNGICDTDPELAAKYAGQIKQLEDQVGRLVMQLVWLKWKASICFFIQLHYTASSIA